MRVSGAILILALALLLLGCGERDLVRSFEFHEGITNAVVMIESGNLDISPNTDGLTTVDVDMTYNGREPELIVEVNGDTLMAYLDCAHDCDGSFSVTVPGDVNVTTEVVSGHICIAGLSGSIDATSWVGQLVASDLSGDLTLRSDIGDIFADNITSTTVYAETYVGDIDLYLFGDLSWAVGNSRYVGDVYLTVPTGTYDLYMEYTTGHVILDGVEDDPNAPNSIDALVYNGDIEITGV